MKPVLKMPQPSRHPHPTVRACRLAHLIFERPDLELAERFFTDFGLVTALKTDDTLYLRGTGPDPYCYRVHRAPRAKFVGFGLCVPSETDLIKISQLPGASPIETCRDPGGGRRSRLTDPSGFLVEVVYGSSESPALTRRSALTFNDGAAPKRVNATQRPPAKPLEINRLTTTRWASRRDSCRPTVTAHTRSSTLTPLAWDKKFFGNADGTMLGGSDGTFSAVKSSIIGKTPGVTNTNITATAMCLPPKRKWELGGPIRRPCHSGGNACLQASAGPS